MAASTELNIWVRLKDDASKQISGITGKIESMQPTFQKMAAGGAVAFGAISAVAIKATADFAEAERSQRQLEHAMIDVSKGTMEQVQAVSSLTDALQKKAGIDGDALKLGAAQLSTFGLQSQSVVDLTKSLADLTVNQNGVSASGDNYVQSANMIAKALNGQFGALEKTGIRFTEAQQQMILYGTEAEKVKAIQEGLNQNLRETTDTVADSVEAGWGRLTQALGEINEALGGALAPALTKAMDALTPLITKFGEFAEAHPNVVLAIFAIAAGAATLVTVLGAIGIAASAVAAGVAAIGGAAVAGAAIAAITALIALGITLYQQWEGLAWMASTAWTAIKEAAIGAWEAIKSGSIDPMIAGFEKLMGILKAVASKVAELASNSLVGKIVGAGLSVGKSVAAVFKRAYGGPVSPGTPYMVGERGPETFVPSMAGTIVPNGGGAAVMNITITGNTFVGPRDFTRQVADELMDILRLQRKLG